MLVCHPLSSSASSEVDQSFRGLVYLICMQVNSFKSAIGAQVEDIVMWKFLDFKSTSSP